MIVEDAPASPFRAGYRLGRYELLCPLAEGGMAVVWIARLQGTRGFEKLVAVKLIRPQLGDEERFEKMFLDEATIASKIHHPNVVQTIDLGEQDGSLYLVMELVEGESLARWRRLLRKRGVELPIPIALRIVADTCAALHAAHELCGDDGRSLGLVHRDVSPQNVLVSFGGAVRVIDFGIAKARNRAAAETTDGVIKGKVPYMAPEQVRGHAIDRGVDIWAAGVCLYELVAGHLPFEGETHAEILHAIASGAAPPPLPETTPASVKTIVARALDPESGRRFATAAAMQRAIESALVEASAVATSDDIAAFLNAHLGDHVAERRARVAEGLQSARARISGSGAAHDDAPTSDSGPPFVTLAQSDLQTIDTASASAVSRATSSARILAAQVTTAPTRRSRTALWIALPVVVLAVVASIVFFRGPAVEPTTPSRAAPSQTSSSSPSTTPSPDLSSSIVAAPTPSSTLPPITKSTGKMGVPSAATKSSSPATAKTLSPAGKDYGF